MLLPDDACTGCEWLRWNNSFHFLSCSSLIKETGFPCFLFVACSCSLVPLLAQGSCSCSCCVQPFPQWWTAIVIVFGLKLNFDVSHKRIVVFIKTLLYNKLFSCLMSRTWIQNKSPNEFSGKASTQSQLAIPLQAFGCSYGCLERATWISPKLYTYIKYY